MRVKYFPFLLLFFWACHAKEVFIHPNEANEQTQEHAVKAKQTVFLIGDAGVSPQASNAVLQSIKLQVDRLDPKNTTIVFLGDNISPKGLHPKDHPLRQQDEERINAQLDVVKDFKGEVFFIPGNHDWAKGGEEGFEAIRRQEKYIQKYLDKKVFEPSDGCSGPETIELSDNLSLIIIDTQWWLHQYRKGRGEKDDCPLSTKAQFVLEFKEALKKNRNKHVIVVGHHPLYSNGNHGGYFTFRNHLFPFTDAKPNLWVPVPLLGSAYPLYRSYIGNLQDLAHPEYKAMQKALVDAMSTYDNVIYASGHEHNLQYVGRNNGHYLVSGAAAKTNHLKFNRQLDFGARKKGFAKIEITAKGTAYMSFFGVLAEEAEAVLLFHKKLYQKNIKGFESPEAIRKKSYQGLTAKVIPDSTFAANKLKRIFLGDLNRDLWTLPIEVPYFDIHQYKGGLVPIEKGGGMQTVGLKLVDSAGYKYKLRRIRKSAEYLVERDLQGTLAQDMVYDGIAGSHPYAAVSLIEMSKAANIYYTLPQLVFLPKDSILGDYQEEFGNIFGLFEMHPNKDMSAFENFGNSKKVVNYHDAIEELSQHHDHQVDQSWVVRSRLFDLLIGDWDRHDDQWRWATFKEGDKTIYRPIPRDRDQAYFSFQGVVMNISNRKWLLRKFQNFDYDIRDIAGLAFNARYFDRYFLNDLSKAEWMKEAEFLQANLTDEVIEKSLAALPKEAYDLNAAEIIDKLKVRRGKLAEFADRYYQVLARRVNINGTIKKDYIEVIHKENGSVEVNLYPRKKGKKVESERYYHRLFNPKETKEVRIYGMGGKDEYEVILKGKAKIKVRMIAGPDEDKLKADLMAKSSKSKNIFYDDEGDNDLVEATAVKVKQMPNEKAYYFDRREFKYDNLIPLPSVGFNVDDGLYLGAGFQYIKQGFKKAAYASKHSLIANYALRAEGFRILYENDYKELFGSFDAGLKIHLQNPEVYQFYGFGNETEAEDSDINNAQVRLNRNLFQTRLSLSSKGKASLLSLLTSYENIGLEEAKFADISLVDQEDELISVGLNYTYRNTDFSLNPSKGVAFSLEGAYTKSSQNKETDFTRLKSELTFYTPLTSFRKQAVIATRFGYVTNIGEYAFYQANFLSGLNEIRGITRNRFAGESVAYGNIEFRKSFLKVKNYVMPFDFGMLLHGDIGRVYVENDTSDKWHNSYGGGFFFNILDYFALVASYSISDQDRVVNFGTNFYF